MDHEDLILGSLGEGVSKKLVFIKFFSTNCHRVSDILIPPGWKRIDNQGKVYYYNAQSKQTVWQAPESTKKHPLDKGQWSITYTKAGVDVSDPKVNPKGKPYFFHKKTKDTRWDAPFPLDLVVTEIYANVINIHKTTGGKYDTFFAMISNEPSKK